MRAGQKVDSIKLRSSEEGQAVLEYLLVMIITVAIILGLMYQFNRVFRTWANSYFGDYLACMLEVGEVPGFGAANNGAFEGCLEVMRAFDVAAATSGDSSRVGGTGGSGGSGGSSGGGSSDSGGGDSSSRNSRNDSSGQGAIDSEAVGQSSARASATDGQGSGSRRRRISTNSAKAGANSKAFKDGNSTAGEKSSEGTGGDERGKKINTGNTEASIPDWATGGNGTRQKIKRKKLKGEFFVDAEQQEERREISMDRGATSSEKQALEGQQQAAPFKRKTASGKPSDIEVSEEMGFGSFMRYLIIAGIIIALVVFLGGQAYQISKSWDS